MFKFIQRLVRAIIVSIFIFSAAGLIAFAWFGIGVHDSARYEAPTLAFWMEHKWASGQINDYALLKQRIETFNVKDLYFHVGPIEPDGSLADDLKLPLQDLPTTDYAWIGQLRSEIDINNPRIRQSIVDSARWLTENGFEGIHVNVEPVPRDDKAFIKLMEELRVALPDVKLSVAMDEWQPDYPSRLLSWFANVPIESYWSTPQVKDISEHVDQMVVMTYDTSFTDPKLFTWWVEQQLITLSRRVAKETELRVGIPSYEEGSALDPIVENIQTGIDGYKAGITNIRSHKDHVAGLAIYSYWEMDEIEWVRLEELQKH